jgi:hypothetical protein
MPAGIRPTKIDTIKRERQVHKPDKKSRQIVLKLSRIGTPQEVIGDVLGIHRETVAKHYRRELDLSAAEANAEVANSLYQSAVSGNTTAAIFWCKTRLGWRETSVIEQKQEFAILIDRPEEELTEEEWLEQSLGSRSKAPSIN